MEKRRILFVSAADVGSGAERIAYTLFRGCRERGHASRLAVGSKHTADPDVIEIPNGDGRRGFGRLGWKLESTLVRRGNRPRGTWRLSRIVRALRDPATLVDAFRGHEDYRYPGMRALMRGVGRDTDVLHCHGLHGGYFDLRDLPALSHGIPTVITLHDEWLFTGHCIYSRTCQRWQGGCGLCPLLHTRPSVLPRAFRHDGSGHNWLEKREIFRRSRVFVASPSEWLLKRAEASILAAGCSEARVIPNGIDLEVFRPGDSRRAREILGLPEDCFALLSVAASIRGNSLKGYETIRAAGVAVAARNPGRNVVLLAVGSDAPVETAGRLEIRFVPFDPDPVAVARFYQASDLYLHGAQVDNFPNTVLEALACGLPVVATAVGGVPEQVRGLRRLGVDDPDVGANRWSEEEATGVLVAEGDAEGMAQAADLLVGDAGAREQMGRNAASDARNRFGLELQVDRYLAWYEAILEDRLRRGVSSVRGKA